MAVIPPGSTIGILGGGQLGRMLAIAAAEMGYHAHIFCPEVDCPAREVSRHTTVASFDDRDALKRFARDCDVVTYEFENIPAAAVADVARHVFVRPGVETLNTAQHRVREKEAVNRLGVATAPFKAVSSLGDLAACAREISFPCVLKTCRMGYDGKGQILLRDTEAVENIARLRARRKSDTDDGGFRWRDGEEYILEGFVDFVMEISVIVARGMDGVTACYCPVQNIHKNHILAETIAPAPISPSLAAKAEEIAKTIAEGLELVGLMAVEMFVTKDERILVNELAPRPHNSGHWTIDACVTSQFQQTIRAICGLPLGSTERLCDARMVNLIGDDVSDWGKYIDTPNAKLHIYGKKESRPGRKMGHVTFLSC